MVCHGLACGKNFPCRVSKSKRMYAQHLYRKDPRVILQFLVLPIGVKLFPRLTFSNKSWSIPDFGGFSRLREKNYEEKQPRLGDCRCEWHA